MPKVDAPRPPTLATLRKYGLTAEDWERMCDRQHDICPVCAKPFGGRKLAIDHEHVRGFKARRAPLKGRVLKRRVMSPAERRRHVRGILHSYCNRFVRRWLTLERAESIVRYLKAHAERSKQCR